MRKLSLPQVTLLAVDGYDVDRVRPVMEHCLSLANFGAAILVGNPSLSHLEKPKGYEIVPAVAPLSSIPDYSVYMLQHAYTHVPTDFALVVQYDGYILNPGAWTDEFLAYDYIGAPWWYTDGWNVGNGGFSLRSRALMKYTADDTTLREEGPEDHMLGRVWRGKLEEQGFVFAPEELAARFSIEGGIAEGLPAKPYGDIWNGEFGFHAFQKTNIDKYRDGSFTCWKS